MTGITHNYERFDRWMLGVALPFWASTGRDRNGLGFVEHLRTDAQPAEVAFKRVRVQARQIYVFSHAALLGWLDGLEGATDSFEFLCRHAQRGDGAWVRRVGRKGGIVDDTADLYDLAFVLLAFAWYHRATGRTEPLHLATRTLEWIERAMGPESGLGFRSSLPPESDLLEQNPHMHLLEACLALYETSGFDYFACASIRLLELFSTKLFDKTTGTIPELFHQDWRPMVDAKAEQALVEPGHQFEWCWLLWKAYNLLGHDLRGEALRLHGFAAEKGTDSRSGLVYDQVLSDGRAWNCATRLWPQTEALRSYLVQNYITGESIDARVNMIVNNIFERFLSNTPAGTWIDHTDAEGTSRIDKIPTSSLYHLFTAYAELNSVMKAKALDSNLARIVSAKGLM